MAGADLRDEHCSVDGTLIAAWASHKRFRPKDEQDPPEQGPGRNAEVDFTGKRRGNDTHAATAAPAAHLYRQGKNTATPLCHRGPVLRENRTGLVVDVDTTAANGIAERQAAVRMLKRRACRAKRRGADQNDDTTVFVTTCRQCKVVPHVATKKTGSSLDGRTTRHATYRVSVRSRQRIEAIFGGLKTAGGRRRTRLIGRAQLAGQLLLGCDAYHRVRIECLNGGWDARHT